MHAYEEMHEGGSWGGPASHPAHARHETQESGSFTLSGCAAALQKRWAWPRSTINLSIVGGQPLSPALPPPIDLALEQPLRCVFQKHTSDVAEPEAVRFAAEGQRCRGGRDGIHSLLPLPLRPSAAEPNVPLAFRRHGSALSSGQGIGVSDPVPAFKRQDPRVSPHWLSEISFRKSYKTRCYHRATTHFPPSLSEAFTRCEAPSKGTFPLPFLSHRREFPLSPSPCLTVSLSPHRHSQTPTFLIPSPLHPLMKRCLRFPFVPHGTIFGLC